MKEEQLLEGLEQKSQTQGKVPLVYSWGRNEDGELAISNAKNTFIPTAPRGLKGFARQIATARTHTAVINDDGQIYMAGSLLFGKIGIPAQVNNYREFHFQSLMAQHKVFRVACGDYHTLALTQAGALFSWGGSLWDKTGHKGGGIHRIERLSGQKIVDIACGDFHSVAVSDNGQIYSWGGGGQNKNKGQLGHSNRKDLPHPELIQFFKGKKVIRIACGDYHTMVMTDEDELFAFGQGTFGQLGTGGKEDSATPKKVVLNFSLALQDYFRSDLSQKTKIQQMALGGHHSLLLTNKGHIYVCGYGAQGQLGLGTGNTENKYQPCPVKSLMGKQIVMVAAGANHSLALTSRHDVYSCGYNAKGQLGIGEDKSITSWTHVAHLSQNKVGRIYAGGDHSWAVIDELEPIISDYEPPSPIRISIDQMTLSRPEAISRKGEKSEASMDSIIQQMNSNRKLQLIITQVELSHRFIHFVVNEGAKNFRKRLDDYLSAVREIEGDNLKHFKVTQDSQVFDAKGQLTLPGNPRGFTVMLVCELPNDFAQHQHLSSQRSKISIGEVMMLDSGMLKIEGKIPIYNKWFFKFSDLLGDAIEKARFIQLRPKRE